MAVAKGMSPQILSFCRQCMNMSHLKYSTISNKVWILRRLECYPEGKSSTPSSRLIARYDSYQFLRAFSSIPEKDKSFKVDSTKILYDGDCKICAIEISGLKRLTRNKDHVKFVDISLVDYNPDLYSGVTYEQAMKEMHVVGPNDQVYTQGDAIRQMYRACGLGWIAGFTELPLIKQICDRLYTKFAKYRLRKALDRCDDGSCSIKLKHLRDKLEKNEL